MSGTYTVVVGDRGRLVLPAEVRDRVGIVEGTPLTMLDTPGGLVLMTREQLKAAVRADLDSLHLVGELVSERRAAAAEDGR